MHMHANLVLTGGTCFNKCKYLSEMYSLRLTIKGESKNKGLLVSSSKCGLAYSEQMTALQEKGSLAAKFTHCEAFCSGADRGTECCGALQRSLWEKTEGRHGQTEPRLRWKEDVLQGTSTTKSSPRLNVSLNSPTCLFRIPLWSIPKQNRFHLILRYDRGQRVISTKATPV